MWAKPAVVEAPQAAAGEGDLPPTPAGVCVCLQILPASPPCMVLRVQRNQNRNEVLGLLGMLPPLFTAEAAQVDIGLTPNSRALAVTLLFALQEQYR